MRSLGAGDFDLDDFHHWLRDVEGLDPNAAACVGDLVRTHALRGAPLPPFVHGVLAVQAAFLAARRFLVDRALPLDVIGWPEVRDWSIDRVSQWSRTPRPPMVGRMVVLVGWDPFGVAGMCLGCTTGGVLRGVPRTLTSGRAVSLVVGAGHLAAPPPGSAWCAHVDRRRPPIVIWGLAPEVRPWAVELQERRGPDRVDLARHVARRDQARLFDAADADPCAFGVTRDDLAWAREQADVLGPEPD